MAVLRGFVESTTERRSNSRTSLLAHARFYYMYLARPNRHATKAS